MHQYKCVFVLSTAHHLKLAYLSHKLNSLTLVRQIYEPSFVPIGSGTSTYLPYLLHNVLGTYSLLIVRAELELRCLAYHAMCHRN